jgi:hypothetical protein
MKQLYSFTVVYFALLCLYSPASAQSGNTTITQNQRSVQYPLVSLPTLLAEQRQRMDSLRAMFADPAQIATWRPVSIIATYQLEDRPLDASTQAVASFACRTYTGNAGFLQFFDRSYLFMVGGQPYWLPFAKTKTGYLRSLTRKGDTRLVLYGIFASHPSAAGELLYTFLVEDFEVRAAD